MEFSAQFTAILAIATVLGNVLALLILLARVFTKEFFWRIMQWVSNKVLLIGLLISAGATIGSLIYSEVVGFPACILCWIQRIFMYPLMFLFGLAFIRKERVILPYALLLTLLGGAVALYNWVKDMLGLYTHLDIACPVVPGLPPCDRLYVLEYGYVTIAMIALNAFVLLAIILWAGLRYPSHD